MPLADRAGLARDSRFARKHAAALGAEELSGLAAGGQRARLADPHARLGDIGRHEPHGSGLVVDDVRDGLRSEEHTSELQSLMRISYAVFCLKKKKTKTTQ